MAEIQDFISPKAEKQITGLIKSMDVLSKKYNQLFISAKKLDDQVRKVSTQPKAGKGNELLAIQKEENRIREAGIRTRAKLDKVTSEGSRKLIKEGQLLGSVNSALKLEAKASTDLLGPFSKLNAQRAMAAQRLKEMIISGTASNGQIDRASKKYRKLDDRLQNANNTLKKLNTSASQAGHAAHGAGGFFKKMGMSLKMMVTMMGPIMAVFAVLGAIGDAFRRIREFDKSIVELSGVLGKSRKELSGLESNILKVASMSTKTSTEVAELATTLATLGKSDSEINNLLVPTNNLSIALKASSQEAGELLVTTLNAFGESSKSAQRFGDVIAKMRTSSALDFERIKDSLSFLSPTAKAAGVTFEQTGAILGVLVDNGIKAARAGRLMSTSFLRLAARGMTLNDGLDDLNKTQRESTSEIQILEKAGGLFGKRAAALGLILANNRDEVDRLTEAYKNSKGTLDELTRVQLTSLDAKLKILNSTWERMILNFTEGDGPMNRAFKNLVSGLTATIRILSGQFDEVLTALEKFRNETAKQKSGLDALVGAITSTNESEDLRRRLIDELNKTYPDFLENIKKEDLTNEKLTEHLRDVNAELHEKLKLAEKESQLAPIYKKLADVKAEETETTIALAKANKVYETNIDNNTDAAMNFLNALSTEDEGLIVNAKNIETLTEDLEKNAVKQYRLTKAIDSVKKAYGDLGEKSSEASQAILTDAQKLTNALTLLNDDISGRTIDLQTPLASANVELAKMKELSKDASLPYLERIAAFERSIELQIQIINWEKELRDLNIQKLQIEFQIEQSLENELKLEIAKAGAITKSASEQKKLTSLQKQANKEIKFLNARISAEKKDILSKGIEDSRSAFMQEVEAKTEQIEIMKRLEQKLNDDVAKINADFREKEQALDKDSVNNTSKRARTSERDKQRIARESVDLMGEIFKGFSDLKIQQLSDEITAINLQRQTALANAEGDKNKEAQINAKFDRKEAIIRQKQLKAEQEAALFNILILTAENIVRAKLNPILIAIAVAMGLAQAAFVKKQKIPTFSKGSKGLEKDTYGEVAEAGREILMFPSGEIGMAEEKTRLAMPKGTVIKSNRETERILAANQLKAQRENDVMVRDHSELRMLSDSITNNENRVLKAVSDQKQYIFEVSAKGVRALMKSKTGTVDYLDKRFA